MRDTQTVFLASWLDACALWRLWVPSLSLPGSSFFIFAQKPNLEVVAVNDVAVVQRCCLKPQHEFMQVLNQLDIRIVYDLDDDVWDLPPSNPAYGPLTAAKAGFLACIQLTDIVTVSTHTLAKVVRRYVKRMVNARGKEIPIVVIPNRIDPRLLVAPRRNEEKVIVGWAGSSSHVEDLTIMEEGLANTAKDFPDVIFEMRGCQPPASIAALPNARFKVWMPVAEYLARMPVWGWHVALAPLTDHPFNASKSCLKMMEAAWCKIPCLASWVKPYDEFTSHDKELRWLLCAAKSNWEPKLRQLLNEEAMRRELGERMYRVLEDHYMTNGENAEWREVLNVVQRG